MKKYTKDEIGKKIMNDLHEALSTINADGNGKLINVDTKNKTVTIIFDYCEVQEDNYIGLASY